MLALRKICAAPPLHTDTPCGVQSEGKKQQQQRLDHSSHSLYLFVAEVTEQEVKIVGADFLFFWFPL